jgi:hypothetical protein
MSAPTTLGINQTTIAVPTSSMALISARCRGHPEHGDGEERPGDEGQSRQPQTAVDRPHCGRQKRRPVPAWKAASDSFVLNRGA